jgi:hypothetical protein
MTAFKLKTTGLVTGAAFCALLAGAAHADENVLAWSSGMATVGVCQVGVTCNQPNGVAFLSRRQSTDTDTDFNRVATGPQDYLTITNGGYFGNAWASAEAGEGLLGLPVLHAFAESRSVGLGLSNNPYIGVDIAIIQAVQGYTNTSDQNLIIPLSAFQGLVDYNVTGAPGAVSAGIAVTTSAILDPLVAAQWSALGGQGHFGEFTAGCGTAGALAIGQSGARNSQAGPATQYAGFGATSCTGGDTYLLAPNETFYVWARLGVTHSTIGVTDASNTFNVTIAPEYQQLVQEQIAPSLQFASGANLDIPMSAVPEPATWAMMILGYGGVGLYIRRRKHWAVA